MSEPVIKRMAEWAAEESKRNGIIMHSVRTRLYRGKYPHVEPYRVGTKRAMFVKIHKPVIGNEFSFLKGLNWRFAPNTENAYAITDTGRVFRLRQSTGTRIGKELKWNMLSPYPMVKISVNNFSRPGLIHLMVIEAFIGPKPSPELECAHYDGNKYNCSVGNLRWATTTENHADKKRHGTQPQGEKCASSKLKNKDVLMVLKWLKDGVSSYRIAKRLGVNYRAIYCIRLGKTWTHLTKIQPKQTQQPI